MSTDATTSEALFSYGTLQLPQVQLATFGRLLEGAPDAILGFRLDWLRITDPDVLATSGQESHPVLHRGEHIDLDAAVDGTVFRITAAELAAADRYEVADYQRVAAPLRSGGQAWVYVARSDASS